ncbi:MAG: transcription-repair coupling factor [Coprobacillaceae bacterium]
MEKILKLLQDNVAYQALLKGKGDLVINQISDEALLYASAFLSLDQDMVIVKANQYEANLLYQEIKSLLHESCLFFPVDESMRIEALAASPELLGERINTMYKLTQDKHHLLVTHTHAIIRHVPSKEVFNEYCLSLKIGQQIDIYELQKRLMQAGYQHTSRVDSPFYFSKRGGIIDVYSMQYDYPLRIEFFDDEIDDIRFYDVSSQRTMSHVKDITLIPASDILYKEDEVGSVIEQIDDLHFDHRSSIDEEYVDALDSTIELNKEAFRNHDTSYSMYGYFGLFDTISHILTYVNNPLIILSSQEDINFQFKNYVEENHYYYQELQSIGKTLQGLPLYHDLYTVLPKKHMNTKSFATSNKDTVFNTRQVFLHQDKEEMIVKQIQEYLELLNIIICLENEHQMKLIIELLERHQLSYTLIGTTEEIYEGINIYVGNIPTGVELVDEHVVILTAKELFISNNPKKTKYFRYKNAKVLKDYQELNVGDYVVHDSHGIGQYLGIKTLEVKGFHKDYLYVAYAGDDTLYIPVEQFKLIRKYASSDGKAPKVHKLGSSQWQKTKQKIRAKVDDIADKLIEIYAARMHQPGFAFKPDEELQIQFENAFGYDLTPDQQRSVDEIKEDMEKPQPMDRLLCGDVGFGKTEVALRAAFKAIISNKQVAFLCPTTILSMQHYKTMKRRFEGFPVTIALLNRFTSSKHKRQILEDVKDGKIDILVGTHRILSKDIQFKDIGLLCVDEEQRFGVKQKEQIKEYRKTIDVLTLTATPIPRTLQMSLMGIRGLSQIETPPKDRLPVQTYVIEKNPMLVKQVIERELARNGQVFYLYNRTSEIANVAYRLSLTIPNANVAVGHGQMSKEELEDVMLRFVNKEFNVLVCTTIIETGIDIPNANTIIVEDADRFGLSQLYQIKGRVGRSDRAAYAYLLYNAQKQMSEEASKRLKAIKEFTELGSGYKIAMRDLAIRGSGDILGGQQAGFIDSIGFEMYMRILQDALDEKTGKTSEPEEEITSVNVNVDGYIPQDYVSSDMEKLELYQRLETVKTLEGVAHLTDEFKDFYGKLPKEVITLIDKRKFDILSNHQYIENIEDVLNTIKITFTPKYSEIVDGNLLFELVNTGFPNATFKTINKKITITLPKNEGWLTNSNQLLISLFDDGDSQGNTN